MLPRLAISEAVSTCQAEALSLALVPSGVALSLLSCRELADQIVAGFHSGHRLYGDTRALPS